MVFSNSTDERSNECCKYNVKCEAAAMDHYQRCRQTSCLDHYVEHQRNLEEYFEYVLHTHDLLNQKLKLLMSELSTNGILDLVEQIYEFKTKSNEIEKTVNIIQQQLHDLIDDDKDNSEEQLTTMSKELEAARNGYLENNIERLAKDIKELKLKFEEINNYSQKRASQEQSNIPDVNAQLDDLSETMELPACDIVSSSKTSHIRSDVCTLRNGVTQQTNDITVLSHSPVQQTSPSIIDINQNECALNATENETYLEGEDERIGVIGSKTTPRISRKIRLSNNFVSWLRGPFRIIVDAPMRVAELCTQETHVNDAVMQAVKKGLVRQEQVTIGQQTTNNLLKPVFAEITPDWTFEGKNSDRGFNSASMWMRDPQGRRILVKIQDHPLCAANEWLAYTLGERLGLLVNGVQIAIYQNNLVTLHTDVTQENEKTISFIDLPKKVKKTLLTDPTMECMDLFDHILQNVDRNPRNILITIPNTTDIDDDNAKLKVHLIDHSSCFGMGKLNVISAVACKFHSRHLSVVKFDPVDEAKAFERYLNRLSAGDRTLIRKTLNRFAAITDNQIDCWMTEVQDLLSSSQYNRIHDVLYRQRDIVERYTIQWGISSRSHNDKSDEGDQVTFQTNDTMFYF